MIASEDLHEFCKLFVHYIKKVAGPAAWFDTMTHLETAMLLVDVLCTVDQHGSPGEHVR